MYLKNKKKQELSTIISKRLKSSRDASGLTLKEASINSGIRIVQIQAFESGQKLPPVSSLCALCNCYAVSIDFICGHSDEPFPEEGELTSGALSHSIADAFTICTKGIAGQLTQFALRAMIGKRRDRVDLMDFVEGVRCIIDHFGKVKQLNPQFDDEIRAGANLENSIVNVNKLLITVEKRIEKETVAKIDIEVFETQAKMFEDIYTRTEEKYKKLIEGITTQPSHE